MKVVYKNIRGYWAMNHEAGKQLGLSKEHTPPTGTIYMNKKFEGKEHTKAYRRIIGHEKFEIHNLRDRHMDYETQESYTNKFERQMGRLREQRRGV